jgi:hypothetical protein
MAGQLGRGGGSAGVLWLLLLGHKGRCRGEGGVETVGSGRPYIPYIPQTGAVCMLPRTIEPKPYKRAVQQNPRPSCILRRTIRMIRWDNRCTYAK